MFKPLKQKLFVNTHNVHIWTFGSIKKCFEYELFQKNVLNFGWHRKHCTIVIRIVDFLHSICICVLLFTGLCRLSFDLWCQNTYWFAERKQRPRRDVVHWITKCEYAKFMYCGSMLETTTCIHETYIQWLTVCDT